MKKSTKKTFFRLVKGVLPYVLVFVLTLGLVALGSLDKQNSEVNLSLDAFAANNYKVSVDQMSELYVVADLSDTLGLASASDVASNYVIATTMRSSGQTDAGKLEKPTITNINASRGIIEHLFVEGDTVDSVAAKYGITADQLRWSNGLKDTAVAIGTTLYVPSVPGIVYTVKEDETAETIAEKYGSSAAEIIALNDLEVSGVKEGTRIVIKGGTLPETERPEYVPPVVRRPAATYTYLGNTSERQDVTVIGWRYDIGGGQCVNWASYMRPDLGFIRGNANAWARIAESAGYVVDRTPAAGSVFQTSSGWYGHVGYVEGVNPDGSITVTEMNYGYVAYRVIRATIPASAVGNFYYIH